MPEGEATEIISLGAFHFLLRAQMAGMAGASPGPSIHRGPTTIHGQRPFQRRIVVAPLAGAMLAGAMLADAMQKREQNRRSYFHGKVLHCTRRSALDDQGTSN